MQILQCLKLQSLARWMLDSGINRQSAIKYTQLTRAEITNRFKG
ncbi:hypothetical protein [Arsenophonus nasoniae]|uniref:Uncharacterized protein n=1 Tax=Arsenophonus nasoniae TaxID=638 RepID=A0AA95GEL1_9GAMM|nr:hypothetical protein [Arsenophonus nasoniae]WGL94883.1 hypothetical protein QE207_14510 [Arsenophonus nasoniae]